MAATTNSNTLDTIRSYRGAFYMPLHDIGFIVGGVEDIFPDQNYHHNGMTRASILKTPSFVLQYTLAGWGRFRYGKSFTRVGEGQAFCAFSPSRYIYTYDPKCPCWTILWVSMWGIENLPARLRRHPTLNNTVIQIAENSPVLQRMVKLLLDGRSMQHQPNIHNKLHMEEGLYRFVWDLERWALSQEESTDQRKNLLDFVRTFTLDNLKSPFQIEDIARAYGLSYSRFAHVFHATTGKTPVNQVNEVRIEETLSLLRTTEMSIKEIADQVGFSTSDYFCKSFRKHYQISPGAYRRLHQ